MAGRIAIIRQMMAKSESDAIRVFKEHLLLIFGLLIYERLRRAASPASAEPNSIKLPGSGVVPLGVPYSVNDSAGIEPMLFANAVEGQPGDVQPTPSFSS